MAAAKATAAGNTVSTATCNILKTCPTLAGAAASLGMLHRQLVLREGFPHPAARAYEEPR